MNLLTDDWLSVDANQTIPINQIANKHITQIIAPRADFKGAIYQFLIGLVQSCFAPKNKTEWKKYWQKPPTQDELKQVFKDYIPYFELDSKEGSYCFMQDIAVDKLKKNSIAALLIESPGGKTIKDNLDHFIKRNTVKQISPYWTAIALYTLQINAPSGGVGHRVSLRGGGPLTTLLLPSSNANHQSLWHQLWMNILTQDEIKNLEGNANLTEPEATFPWLAPTRTSEKNTGQNTHPQAGHPLQMYWSMPRRILIDWKETKIGHCDLTGEPSKQLIQSYYTQNYGVNYNGEWIHPLTPYALQINKDPLSIKAQPGGLGYRHWLSFVMGEIIDKTERSPALVVQNYKTRWRAIDKKQVEKSAQLWAFGYDMDNMKARCWYETTMPIFNLEGRQLDNLHNQVQKMITAANQSLSLLRQYLKEAWFKRPRDAKGDFSFLDHSFWTQTENDFYHNLEKLVKNSKKVMPLNTWGENLLTSTLAIFDHYVLCGENKNGNIRKQIEARNSLEKWLRINKAMKALKS